MSATRQALSQVHPAKTNVLSVGLICVLILIVSLQIWLLSASLNTSLGGEAGIAWPAFYASVVLFLSSLVALSYLPLPIRLMATVTLWFPKKLQGSALGINGLGNLGVTVAQFTVPLVIGFSLAGVAGATPDAVAPLHLENAALVWVPFILICTAAIWFWTEDYPSKPQTIASQLVAGKRLHTWVLSLLYFLTFGCFVAMGASLPLIIKEVFASAPGGAPSPLLYAPWAAAIATLMRPVGGWLADKLGLV